jgi:hypothetical protein
LYGILVFVRDVRLDRQAAEREFERAIAAAVTPQLDLPRDWLEVTTRLGQARSKTFVAMLGTALLARATSDEVDPLCLKDSATPSPGLKPYSARGLATNVLVPCSVRHGVHLGVTGREPLNNQPFYAEERVHKGLPTRPADRADLGVLVDALDLVARMPSAEAQRALAAFVRIRREAAVALQPSIAVGPEARTLPELIAITAEFVNGDAEGGRRGQAMVAAALDIAFDEVMTGRVNDPSRRGPGDVRVYRKGDLRLAVEVKQREASETDVLLFAQAIAEWRLAGGIFVALSDRQSRLNEDTIRRTAVGSYGVGIDILTGVAEVVSAVASWGLVSISDLLDWFPERMLKRLEELEVSVAAQQAWSSRFT